MASDSATHDDANNLLKLDFVEAIFNKRWCHEITEGSSNLYFTNERVDDRVGALLISRNWHIIIIR